MLSNIISIAKGKSIYFKCEERRLLCPSKNKFVFFFCFVILYYFFVCVYIYILSQIIWFSFINFILQEIEYNYILFNFIFNIFAMTCHLSGSFLISFDKNSAGFDVKSFWWILESGFHSRKFTPSNRFAVIEKGNNQLVQGQEIMASGAGQTKQVHSCVILTMWSCFVMEENIFFHSLYMLPRLCKN